jgi:glycogen phosphorylase
MSPGPSNHVALVEHADATSHAFETRSIAYFSMEIALEPSLPTYSGGLGILAGDTLRAAADLSVPMAGVSLVHRHGYFRQTLNDDGSQSEHPDTWQPEQRLELAASTVTLSIAGRDVHVRAWIYRVRGVSGYEVPVYLLDTDLPENDPQDRTLTDSLYAGDARLRLAQEAVLGMAGVQLLRSAGYRIDTYHLNEGHSALLVLSLLEAERAEGHGFDESLEAVRARCVFTTHTPVAAGHDRFHEALVRDVLGDQRTDLLQAAGALASGELNMTDLALRYSRYANGVAMRHGEVSRKMFPDREVRAITNGIHAATWAAPAFAELFDRHLPEWRRDNLFLRYAEGIATDEIGAAHRAAKIALLALIEARSGVVLLPDVLTIGFARRATGYKRANLIFEDVARLARIAQHAGPIQIVYGGKAHPSDEPGKAIIQSIFRAARDLRDDVRVVYLENYDMALAQYLVPGVDLWLNTPERPLEASGTSGMKAALNGVPSLSVLDGWWVEGCVPGVTGWSIGEPDTLDASNDARSLYDALDTIVPLFYASPEKYAQIMRSSIALNASFFNTQRMVTQYVRNAYAAGERRSVGSTHGL